MYPQSDAARCEALFASDLQASQHPDHGAVRTAIEASFDTLGAQGCAARVAQEFGDHPETALTRMRWARHECESLTGPNLTAA